MAKASRPRTKTRLLYAGIKEFSAHGYRGASLRDIARLADTNVAAVKYHYQSKEKLWQAVVSYLYRALSDTILDNEERHSATSTRELIRNSTRSYILFSAKNPELYRITLLEMIDGGERLEWLARYHLREFMERTMAWTSIAQQHGVFPKEIPPLNLVYVMMGAIQTIFMMAPQIDRSFGVDVFDDRQIESHIDTVMRLFNL
ncbi:TetR/AcrR family transcriptional regulator [Leptolyngbya sp. 7M]|uniref:TetR/AcrR family transcriptional regulator n=1 Tax=Leptolyngbya sp. 7M TaxID=2812896 RepID=UPI001B8C5727|nr:TetR family transcriptional regulator [Leptolyngbya sp. 7M]QYO65104.1 TetR family transcriptional regulator [Leptolyngbya sp. 7M]QYU70781.1 TetR family transcriptional regulator [Leptolyngbya sp. 15MV]